VAYANYPVRLVHRDWQHLTGTVADQEVGLDIGLPDSDADAAGRMGEATVSAVWRVASNYHTTEQPASLDATIGDCEIALSTTFIRVGRGVGRFVEAEVAGEICGEPLRLLISPGNTASGHRSVAINGTASGLPVELGARATGDLENVAIAGTIGGIEVRMTATQPAPGKVRISGEWAGPLPLCLLTACGLVYFI
jgi:hypothetical protein